jgi:hypothetical protein
MKVIVGNTGLVGKTMCQFEKFDLEFNSKNIDTFIDLVPNDSELFLTCLPATKWLVNKNLVQDINNIHNIINTISKKTYSKVTLISTIDVYNDSPLRVNESYSPNISKLSYGNNRYFFELLVREFVKTDNLKIFRLPALFNKNIKKNILFDLIHNNNVEQINANSSYQWMNLDRLPEYIEYFNNKYPNDIIFNLFPAPIDTKEIISLFPISLENVKFSDQKVVYDYTTMYSFSGYFRLGNKTELEEIKQLINEFSTE